MLKVVTLRWTNTAINAGNITIQRKLDSGEYVLLGTLDPNVEQYIDIMELDDLPVFESVTYEVNTTAVVAGETRVGEPGTITLTQAELGDIGDGEESTVPPAPEPGPTGPFDLGVIRTAAEMTEPFSVSLWEAYWNGGSEGSGSMGIAARHPITFDDGVNPPITQSQSDLTSSDFSVNLLPGQTYRMTVEMPAEKVSNARLDFGLNGITNTFGLIEWPSTPIWDVSYADQILLELPKTPPPMLSDYAIEIYSGSSIYRSTIVDASNVQYWDISNRTDLSSMFREVTGPDDTPVTLPIENWNVSHVTDMSYMFSYANVDVDLSNWDVSNVTNMEGTFQGSTFNSDISNWNVSNVTNMEMMFYGAKVFNGDLTNWNVSNINGIPAEFIGDGSSLAEENQPRWGEVAG